MENDVEDTPGRAHIYKSRDNSGNLMINILVFTSDNFIPYKHLMYQESKLDPIVVDLLNSREYTNYLIAKAIIDNGNINENNEL